MAKRLPRPRSRSSSELGARDFDSGIEDAVRGKPVHEERSGDERRGSLVGREGMRFADRLGMKERRERMFEPDSTVLSSRFR